MVAWDSTARGATVQEGSPNRDMSQYEYEYVYEYVYVY